ncbi:Uncharacterised protein [Mycobacteroides abscessus subsp. abscessus]|nr:Uncharacterised protein [Mycobacteroides abscessus subsp. abscessus]SKW10278.1 Uncharacterised protein [Mycobacteroides abscessus subsp. abscessus]
MSPTCHDDLSSMSSHSRWIDAEASVGTSIRNNSPSAVSS